MNTNKNEKYWLIRIISFSLLTFIIVICSKNSSALYYNGGVNIEDQSLKVEKLFRWLEFGEGKTLVVSHSFLFPPVFANGKPIYESVEEREEYYSELGIWKKVKLKEYRIKEISWVHSNLQLINQGNMKLKALLPEKDIINNLPENSKILLKGKTVEGKEVPLIYEMNRGNNRIINVVFSLKSDFSLERSITMSILSYIKNEGKIVPDIPCKAHTGYPTWQGKNYESEHSDKVKSFILRWDTEGKKTEGLSLKFFLAGFLKNGKPAAAGMSLTEENLIPITLNLCDNMYEVSLFKQDEIILISMDNSVLGATYYYTYRSRVIASTDSFTQWLIETLDGRDYVYTNLFRVFTESSAKILFLRPIFWVEEELIHAFMLKEDILEPVTIKIDREILILESKGGNYFVYYGDIKEKELSEFWKKFCVDVKNRKEIRSDEKIDYNKYWNDFNVHWVEF